MSLTYKNTGNCFFPKIKIKENKGGCLIIIHHKVRTKTTDSHPHFHGAVFADYFWGLLTVNSSNKNKRVKQFFEMF
jgi:hypothetical protein